MLFNEIYSAYYNAVAGIISEILEGNTDKKALSDVVEKYAFGESVLSILPSLKKEKWMLVNKDLTTPIKNKPTMPLTLLEKRWLKALSLDERIKLFDFDFSFLSDVEPLFTPDDFVVYDRYLDGDDYSDEGYISRFKLVLSAIKEKKALNVQMLNRHGKIIDVNFLPSKLEYSEKDDKFRVIGQNSRDYIVINLGRVVSCRVTERDFELTCKTPESRTFTLLISDERNALERCMLHFAHFEKRAEKIDETHYKLYITYDVSDETELVIRVLSFGPMVEVTEPESFRNLIKERLIKQKGCGL